ncbi:MAG TPA: metallophosphoesterase family protein [Candidatus Acidoferrum sp.]|nr:metallophosphoesterase family protein [Candidatus Acidoferrum sp.]
MSRTLVIGDIHGGLKALKQVLQRAAVTANDLVVFLGDYVDGWSESPGVIDFLIDYKQRQRCILLRGNHDMLLLDWLCNGNENPNWLKHGGRSTLAAYKALPQATREQHAAFIENDLVDFYQQDNGRLFVHAGFTHIRGFRQEYFKPMLYWDRSLWETALALDPVLTKNDARYPSRLKLYPEVFIGHTPTIHLNSKLPMNAACVWNLDTGAGFTGPLTLMDADSKRYWQSDEVYTLYPGEEPRVV